jgi:hypothetical protein
VRTAHRGTNLLQVPVTFVNEQSCVRRASGTCSTPTFKSTQLTLDHDTMRKFYTTSSKHVHHVTGLRLEPNVAGLSYFPPCTDGESTRWIKVAGSGGCNAVAGTKITDAGTARVIAAAIKAGDAPFEFGSPSPGMGVGSAPAHVLFGTRLHLTTAPSARDVGP